MTAVPVVLSDGIDFLEINAKLRKGTGQILIAGPVSLEIEDEIKKAISFAAELADLGEFEFPDLSRFDLYLSLSCRSSELPVVGSSYGLGLGVEILRCFSNCSLPPSCCYTGAVTPDGVVHPVGMLREKRDAAARAGYERIFVPAGQLEFFCPIIDQSPVGTIFDAWGILSYAD